MHSNYQKKKIAHSYSKEEFFTNFFFSFFAKQFFTNLSIEGTMVGITMIPLWLFCFCISQLSMLACVFN